MKRLICVLVVLVSPLILVAGDNDVRKELKALEGKWKAVALEAAGKSFPKDEIPDFTFTIAADGKGTARSPKGEHHTTITVDPKKNPKTIDNFHDDGDEKGKKQYGIYKLEGDKFTVCITRAGSAESDRPKEFTTKDSKNVLFVFERIKDDKKP